MQVASVMFSQKNCHGAGSKDYETSTDVQMTGDDPGRC